MADILLVGSEGGFESDDYETEDVNMFTSALDATTQDELLSPLAKLEKYIDSDNVFNRQAVARGLLDTFRYVTDNPEERETVIKAMGHMSDDVEMTVRAELMEQIPHIAMFCQDHQDNFPDTVSRCVIPMITRYLTDINVQVRKTSQAAVLVLLEQELIDKQDVEDYVCPVIIQLTGSESSDDYRTEAVALMTKMAPLLGTDIAVRVILPRFSELCTDALFHIRKVCASNFGDICSVVGTEKTEEILLEKFEYLCEDGVWGVRKACAECFTQVSLAVNPESRREYLSRAFVRLLCDQSRWVRMAAFQALGPFISTFADPGKTGLTFNADGSITVKADAEVLCEPTTSDKPHRTHKHKNKQQDMFMEVDESSGSSSAKIFLTRSSSPPTTESDISEAEKEIAVDENVHMAVGELTFSVEASASETEKPDEKEEFNSFMFWREPLLSVDDEIYTSSTSVTVGDFSDESNDHNSSRDNTETDSDKVQNSCDGDLVEQVSEVHLEPANKCTYEVSKLTGNKVEVKEVGSPLTASVCDVNEDTAKDKKLHTASVNEVNELTETVPNIGSQQVLPQRLNENTMTIVNGITSTQDLLDGTTSEGESEDSSVDDDQWRKQDVIPHDLLENYLSMIDPQRAQTVDTEIAKHCAYSLPGVAFTLGRRNWHCIKDIYETLASDMQWKVRRTLAFSIHEMAVILGDQITSDDLVPVFNGFLKDLDEVRIGVLKHLADFLRLLNKGMRKEYLIRLTDFLQTDNQRNWRFRHELSLQLVALCDLFSPLDVIEYIFPIAITLAGDRVAEVRTLAYKLLSIILKKLRDDNSLHKRFIDDIVNRYAESNRWFGRQTFAHLCQSLLAEESLCEDDFAEELLPHLLELARDNVPNVRLAVSRTLASHVIPSDYFCSKENPKYDALQYVFVQLQEDADRDVRFYMAQSNNMYINFADGDSDEPPV